MKTHGEKSKEFKFKIMELHYEKEVPIKILSEKFGIPEPTNKRSQETNKNPLNLLNF